MTHPTQIGGQQFGEAFDQLVERPTAFGDLLGPVGYHPGVEVSTCPAVGGVGEFTHRLHDRGGQPVGERHGAENHDEAQHGQDQP